MRQENFFFASLDQPTSTMKKKKGMDVDHELAQRTVFPEFQKIGWMSTWPLHKCLSHA